MTTPIRCPWSLRCPEETLYHDTEWGLPHFDDSALFELMIMESAQAGLSWETILKKREGYRKCFTGHAPETVAAFTQADVERLVLDPSIVRHRKKIEAAISNARLFCETAAKYGSFSRYLWDFVDGKPIINAWTDQKQVPAITPLAQTLAKDLKKRGFTFLGPATVYAYMQASGMVNDHLVSCFRYHEVQQENSPNSSVPR